jgi:hypothetical protein
MEVIKKFDYVNYQHNIIVNTFLGDMITKVADVGSDKSFSEVVTLINIVIDYHNEFNKTGGHEGYLQDYLNIIPINVTVAIQGYLIGISSCNDDANFNEMLLLRKEITEKSYDCVDKLQGIKIEKD